MVTETKRESTQKREAFFIEFAKKARTATKLPLMLTGGFRWRQGMEKALADNVVDFIGVARPFVTDIDNIKSLLEGKVEEIKSVELSFGTKVLDSGIQTLWYDEQIEILSRGLTVDNNRTRLRALLIGSVFQYFYNPHRSPGTWKIAVGGFFLMIALAIRVLNN